MKENQYLKYRNFSRAERLCARMLVFVHSRKLMSAKVNERERFCARKFLYLRYYEFPRLNKSNDMKMYDSISSKAESTTDVKSKSL